MGKFYNSKHNCLSRNPRVYRHHSEMRAYKAKGKEGELKTLKVKPVEKQVALLALAGLVIATYLLVKSTIHFGWVSGK